jgi:UDP-glucose 4-epimerase
MRSLVTGGAGFIGSTLVDTLLELGHKVICVDNEYSDVHEQFYWNDKAENVRGDIRDLPLMKSLMKDVDYVFHLAAEARIQPAIENPINAVSINSLGTCTVLQAARECGVSKVLYSSTSSGYGMNPYPNVETQPDDCLNPYSVSKVNGEKLCKMYTDLYGLKTVIFRYFNVYGERQPLRGQYAPVIGIFLRQRDAGEALTIVGDGEQRRDFTHVKDIVKANVMAAIANPDEEAYGQVYNVGTGTNYSVNEVADMVSDNQVHIPARRGESRITKANNQKIYHTFGWTPDVNLEEWVTAQVNGKEQVTA